MKLIVTKDVINNLSTAMGILVPRSMGKKKGFASPCCFFGFTTTKKRFGNQGRDSR